ncbi:hypothetical protein QIF44_06700 [Stenotrophomonas indicatrix]|uniref:hypothetical protein n=1 Tax=Stenotrophomonas indicatrix TaxID=2045451 RepID=UPI00249AB842|nr:hypothetical protein [Stenotrophomonas indicatrix]WGV56887.1 hypothetical protein QIF44_06700 [Stenotrophomonas indicatrix]
MTEEQFTILRAIADARPVGSDAATWAVKKGLAVQAEDADIDLTPHGRDMLASQPAR